MWVDAAVKIILVIQRPGFRLAVNLLYRRRTKLRFVLVDRGPGFWSFFVLGLQGHCEDEVEGREVEGDLLAEIASDRRGGLRIDEEAVTTSSPDADLAAVGELVGKCEKPGRTVVAKADPVRARQCAFRHAAAVRRRDQQRAEDRRGRRETRGESGETFDERRAETGIEDEGAVRRTRAARAEGDR